jgi:hypothetical protein
MTQQMDRRPDTEISRQSRGAKKSNRAEKLVAVLLAAAVAGFVGVAVVTHLTGPGTTTEHVFHVPDANAREGRVPTTLTPVEPWGGSPNANAREGRVPTSTPSSRTPTLTTTASGKPRAAT